MPAKPKQKKNPEIVRINGNGKTSNFTSRGQDGRRRVPGITALS
jgi:hypothetical protein